MDMTPPSSAESSAGADPATDPTTLSASSGSGAGNGAPSGAGGNGGDCGDDGGSLGDGGNDGEASGTGRFGIAVCGGGSLREPLADEADFAAGSCAEAERFLFRLPTWACVGSIGGGGSCGCGNPSRK